MKIKGLKVDYYSGYEGEPEIRFYIKPKGVDFHLDRQQNGLGGYNHRQIGQGEYGIYFFSLWDGYFHRIAHALRERAYRTSVYFKAPKFLKDWNQAIGWCWGSLMPELIPPAEITWLLNELSIMHNEKEGYSKELESEVTNYNCIRDLMLFLEFAERENMEIRISLE
ncbi:MAG: hypothetical protein R8P61_11305 [Bacteroidia bacterium]|nr:hypothetical protein [Bacteroidia bacterium]